MRNNFYFHPEFIVRSPYMGCKTGCTEEVLLEFLSNDAFKEALYLASPNLYKKVTKWTEGNLNNTAEEEKLKFTLAKYFSRMQSRSTPFGLFAGCSIVKWSKNVSHIQFDPEIDTRITRLDMSFLCELGEYLEKQPEIKNELLFFPNSSLYNSGDEIRFVYFSNNNKGERLYQISSVTRTRFLDSLLEFSTIGSTRHDLIGHLVKMDITRQVAEEYVDSMIDSQILGSELLPNVTGESYFKRICRILERINSPDPTSVSKSTLSILKNVEQMLEELDNRVVNSTGSYGEIISSLEDIGIPLKENRIFQADLVKGIQRNEVNMDIQTYLVDAWEVLNALSVKGNHTNLHYFAKRYLIRYGEEEMPLVEVLDAESGIGYPVSNPLFSTPLVEGIQLSNSSVNQFANLEWTQPQRLLWEKLIVAKENNQYTIELTEGDIAKMEVSWDDIPSSVSMIFRMVDDSDGCIYLESVGGISAMNLLGRFSHLNAGIADIIQAIARKEEELFPQAIVAEIVHLPQPRMGNVVQRKGWAKYEIPLLGSASVPHSFQIPLDDLFIRISNGRIALRSSRLKKEVIPRFSTAFNFHLSPLPTFRFLCDLQSQGLRTDFSFNWGDITLLTKFFPRVISKRVILHRATWRLDKSDLAPLISSDQSSLSSRIEQFREVWNLPQFFCLVEGDNELLVNTEELFSVQTFISSIKGMKRVVLKEFLFDENVRVEDLLGNKFSHQLVASVFHKTIKPKRKEINPLKKAEENKSVVQKFPPGSEWLYYKLYCGFRSADNILLQVIEPIKEELIQQDLIDKWFFVRYGDPEWHLRVRFHIKDITLSGTAINLIQSHLAKSENAGIIWKTQLVTYQREVGRYGGNTIELVESLFYDDSENILSIIEKTFEGDQEENRWLASFLLIDDWMNQLDFPINEKVKLMETSKDKFFQEFNIKKRDKIDLDKKFRVFGNEIRRILENQDSSYPFTETIGYRRSIDFQEKISKLKEMHRLKELEVPLLNLANSFIHMSLNRLIPANQRLHELSTYYYMYRYYRSKVARGGTN
ncbi:MAG: lantibiotic dehydratase [Bacteroidota bacterium]